MMTFNIKNGYCCEDIKEVIQEHQDALDTPVTYIPKFRQFIIMNCPSFKHTNKTQRFCRHISYCPWCGSKFPPSLVDIYHEILRTEFPHDNCEQRGVPGVCYPLEFASDEWWKKRKL